MITFIKFKRKLNLFLNGKDAKNLEESIENLIKDTSILNQNLLKISAEQEKQEKMLSATIKKIGIVRFNPFDNTGSDQSFAIALLNSKNSGIMISSLFLRESTRIYAKPIINLKSIYPLSKEEEAAIQKAIA